jgi:hypothetical protein
MDSKHQENFLKKYDEKNLEKFQSIAIFSDPTYLFIFKKTEKVIAALYLITNLVLDSEPIKWQIRKVSIGLMSDILNLKRLSSSQHKQAITGIVVAMSEVISLLKVASISDQISLMNCAVVQKELTLLIGHLESLHPDAIGSRALALPQNYFDVPEPELILARTPMGTMFSGNLSRTFSPKGQYRTSVAVKDNQTQQAPRDNLKDSRHEKILQLLKAGKPLGIKDFAKEIKGCSEKTLQRELLSMVGKGVLKKTGERRWSLYSLM